MGTLSPNVSSDSVIYIGTTLVKTEANVGTENAAAIKMEGGGNDDAELSQILDSFLSMNLNTTPIQREYIGMMHFFQDLYLNAC